MRKVFAAAAAAMLLGAVAIVPSASAAPAFPISPADANCHGALIANSASGTYIIYPDGTTKNGNLGQLAKAFDTTVKDIQASINGFCDLA